VRRLNRAETLARMRSGEALEGLDYARAVFPDGAKPGAGVMQKLVNAGLVEFPKSNIGSFYTLTPLPSA
jgi:hypothetical protein